MNGKRCAILLGVRAFAVGDDDVDEEEVFVSPRGAPCAWRIRIFGSHSEAKRELTKWLPAWPDAKIVEERDL